MKTRRCTIAIAAAVLIAGFFSPVVAFAQQAESLQDKVSRGYEAYTAGNWTEAEGVFREVCAEYEDAGSPWGYCHLILGVILGQPGQGAAKRAEALAQLDIARDLVTTDAERYQVLSSIANLHLLDRDWSAAIAAADDATPFAANEDEVAALAKVKGQAHYQSKDYAGAVSELTAALAVRTGEPNLHAFLGHALFEGGDKAQALDHLAEAVRLDRDNVIGLFFAARIYVEDGDYEQALELAERAVQAKPQDPGVRILLGSAYLGIDRYADAAQQFEIVVAERPDDGTAIYNLGRAYSGLEDWPRAVERFQAAQDLLPPGSATLGALLFDVGVGFEKLERYEDALGAYRDSVAIADDPRKQEAIENVQERIRRGKGRR